MGSHRAIWVAGLSGFAVMALELTAVRLMAPYFGTSAYVWTNVIGVILVALALGAFLGGRLAGRQDVARPMALLLALAALITGLLPLVVAPVCAWLIPGGLQLDAAMPALIRGSLVATALFFAPPVFLAGCASPMLVTALTRAEVPVGRAAGVISAAGTLGSLCGTFCASHLLIPHLGSRLTVWLCALMLLACAALCRRERLVLGGLLLLPLPFLGVFGGSMRAAPAGAKLLAEVESPYQYLQVLREDSQAGSRTILKINEGLDSFHSLSLAGSPYTAGGYYDYHAVMPWLAGDGKRPEPLRVLSLGEAAGTFGRLFGHVHPGLDFEGVEIDPAVTALGAAHFHEDAKAPGRVYPLDARCFVNHSEGAYEVVLVDTYAQQIYIPAHICSRQFFRQVERVLVDGGVVSVNAGGLRRNDPVIVSLAGTMAAVFGECAVFPVPRSRNFVLASRKGRPLDPAVLGGLEHRDRELQAVLGLMKDPARWDRVAPAADPLDDDQPYLDVLQEEVYAPQPGPVRLCAIHGDQDPAVVEGELRRLSALQRHAAVLDAVSGSRQANPNLRIFAGNARWSLRDPEGAVLEYEEARRLGSAWAGLAGLIEDVKADIAERQRSREVASRNAWLAWLVCGGLLCLALWGIRRLPQG